jgi:hypothetical protein
LWLPIYAAQNSAATGSLLAHNPAGTGGANNNDRV